MIPISPDAAYKVLDTLVSEGRLSQDDLAHILTENPDPEMCRTVDLIHSTLCLHDHKGNTEQSCLYYQEELLEGSTWSKPAHQRWMRDTIDYMTFYKINTRPILIDLVRTALSITENILSSKSPDFVIRVVESVLMIKNRKANQESFNCKEGREQYPDSDSPEQYELPLSQFGT